jgi:tetratricopeptide (TPR) repeat protein
MSRIVTFYSYKGGVGRTLALANVAVLLAKRGKKILLMDWDIEAPGLDRYFKDYLPRDFTPKRGLVHLLTNATKKAQSEWRSFVQKIEIDGCETISIITSGDRVLDYAELVQSFSWADFFGKQRGGDTLDRWRDEWKKAYDFVLVDSRTGITDTGGVCTVFLPDILVLVFTANDQSFDNGIQIANGIQVARRELSVPRPPLLILPLPGRFDGRAEVNDVTAWMNKFSKELKPFYDDWLPKQFEPRKILELTKIPYVTKFSFGEPLPVLTHSMSDPEFPGFYLENIARLIASDFADAAHILSPRTSSEIDIATIRATLAQFPIDESAIERSITLINAETGASSEFFDLLNEVGVALARQNSHRHAELYFRQALKMGEELFGQDHPRLLATLKPFGDLMTSMRRLSEAERLYQRSLQIVEHTLDANDPRGAEIFNNLGNLFEMTGRLGDAEVVYRKALNRLRETGSAGDQGLAIAYHNLGSLLQERGDLAEAERTYRDAVDRLQSDRHSCAMVMRSLASVLQRAGRLQEATDILRQTRMIFEELRDEHALVMVSNNLGNLLQLQGHFAEAVDTLRQAVLISEKLDDDRDLGIVLISLGATLGRTEQFTEAADTLRRAEFIFTKLGDERGLGIVLTNLSDVLRRQQHFQEAADVLERTKSIAEKLGDVAFLARILYDFGVVLEDMGRHSEALITLQRSRDLFVQLADQRGEGTALKGLATVLQRVGRSKEAKGALKRSQELLRK